MKKHRSATKLARSETCNRTCNISWCKGPHFLCCLFGIRELSQCPCALGSVWGVLGMAQHGFKALTQLLRAAETQWTHLNCAANMASYGWFQSWFRSHGSKSHSAKPRSVKFECFGLDEWSTFVFPLHFFYYYYCLSEIETTLKYQIKQVP